MVAHPDQSEVPDGSLRIILSLRATGEGHVSSITFRTGLVDSQGNVSIDPPHQFVVEPEIIPNPLYDKPLFRRKLFELGLYNAYTQQAIERLEESFTLSDLRTTLDAVRMQRRATIVEEKGDVLSEATVLSLAISNYEVQFRKSLDLSQRIIFRTRPPAKRDRGCRFVHFQDDKRSCYYATYSAYDGRLVLPQLIGNRGLQPLSILHAQRPGCPK